MNLKVVSAIARKDIVDAIRNRYILVALMTPLFMAILFRVLLPGLNSLSNMTIVVHDPSDSQMVSELRTAPQINLIKVGSAEGVAGEVENSDAVGGLAIPTTFDTEVASGKQPELTVYINHKKSSIQQSVFRQMMEQKVLALVKPIPARLVWIDVAKEEGAQPEAGFNLNQMLFPLLLLITFGMSGAFVVPLLLVEEKEKRTVDFLLTSPASLIEIVMGKALTGAVYSLLIAGVLLALNRKLVGNWPLTVLTLVIGLLLVVAIGLFMGSLFKNTMQVNTWASLVLMVLLAPSFPTPGLSATLETASRLIPTYYFVEALRLSMAGTASARLWGHLAVVLGCTVLALVAATWGLRRQQN